MDRMAFPPEGRSKRLNGRQKKSPRKTWRMGALTIDPFSAHAPRNMASRRDDQR
jgi:hypothetical protein